MPPFYNLPHLVRMDATTPRAPHHNAAQPATLRPGYCRGSGIALPYGSSKSSLITPSSTHTG